MKILRSLILAAFGLGALCPAALQAHDLVPTDPAQRERLRRQIADSWTKRQQETAPSPTIPPPTLPVEVAAQESPAIDLTKAPAQSKSFQFFLPAVKLSWDDRFLYVGSNGLPDHPMMIGITAWQQQVPLPQTYVGENAWRIPLNPTPAREPAMIKGRFLRGAIALGVNGIPIFNPQNNRGDISYEIGELDKWGGHCGRADDYHYHIAPLHLQSIVGKAHPIAYALDGYPIFGLTEPDGSPVTGLDSCHGHEDSKLGYHYHAAMEYPYVIGGFHGEVVEAQEQVDPQPRATPVRDALPALRGAEITSFAKTADNAYQLSYQLEGETRSVRYRIEADGTYPFEFDNGRDGINKTVYTPRPEGGGGGGGGGMRRPGGPGERSPGKGKGGMRGDSPQPPPPPREDAPPPPRAQSSQPMMDLNGDGILSAQEFADSAKREFESGKSTLASLAAAMAQARREFQEKDLNQSGKLERSEWVTSTPSSPSPQVRELPSPAGMNEGKKNRKPEAEITADQPRSSNGEFLLTSTKIEEGAEMPLEYTGDGAGITPPLEWSHPPVGTAGFALIMDHTDREGQRKWYWTLYGLPASATNLPEAAKGIGTTGTSFKGIVGYEPPHSQGPGTKVYTITLYALSAPVKVASGPESVDRESLLAAMDGKILATSSLRLNHTSSGASPGSGAPARPAEPPPMAPAPGGPKGGKKSPDGLIKPSLSDTMKLNVYADNWFMLYVNGRLVAVDPIPFTPHNVVSLDFLPEYPMTIAVLAKDNADPKTGMEYGTSIGDGGLVLKFADGTVTDASWKAKSFFHGPIQNDTANPKVQAEPLPDRWWAIDFDDRSWEQAKEYTVEEVDPKQPYFENDFADAKFIWTGDLALDNTIIFRKRVEKPGWTPRWNTKPDLDVTGAPLR
jgi:phosphatidylethanolamine-binding protein (PEBP) family uncharacterized protein